MALTLEEKIQKLNADFAQKMQEVQASGNYQAIAGLTIELQAQIEVLVENEQKVHALKIVEPLFPEKTSPYRQEDCTLSLDNFVYDGDRDYFAELVNHPLISSFKEQVAKSHTQGPDTKRELLKRALRLTPVMAPKVFRSVDRCRETIGFKPDIHVYVAQDPHMNAFCYPPQHGAVHILLTSSLLEKLTEDELTFVMGHELGHYLYKHHELSPQLVLHHLGTSLSPAECIKLFAWQRNAELSADRVGLIACGSYEAACLANFKISSGVTSDALLFSLDGYVRQYEDMEKDIASGTATLEDLYSSHPINPIRVIALDVFQKSETFRTTQNETNFEYSEMEMEKKIAGFMKLMEPEYLNSNSEVSRRIKEALFLAGYTIALSDGEVETEEMAYLMSILPGENHTQLQERLKDKPVEMLMAALAEQVEKIRPHMSQISSCNFIRDVIIVALTDGELTADEVGCLVGVCDMFGVHPSFIDHVLNSIATQNAA
ncbi:MAG: M48 family metallopeptidase [Bdellovibrionota bacterium]